jgi:DNA-binding transcriptional LysR family regulator
MAGEDFHDLIAFVAVAQERSFTRAATKLGVSQSALSQTVRGLEARIGVRLLNRTTRSVSPTAAGDRLLRMVAPRFEEITSELAALSELRDKPAGTIRLTAVRIGPDLRMAVVGAPAYFARRPPPRTPQDLIGHDCINLRLPAHRGIYAWEFERNGRELKVRVDGQLTFNTSGLILNAALGGFGLAYVTEQQVQKHLDSGELVRVLASWCPPFSGYHLYYASRRQPSAAFAILVEALRYRRGPRVRNS